MRFYFPIDSAGNLIMNVRINTESVACIHSETMEVI